MSGEAFWFPLESGGTVTGREPVAAGDPTLGERVTIADSSRHLTSAAIALVGHELVMLYRDGPSHNPVTGATRGLVRMVRSGDLGRTWTSPVTVVDDNPADANDPCLTLLDDGRLALAYKSWDGTGNTAWVRFSDDQGASFGSRVAISSGATSAISAPIVELADGTLLAFHYDGGTAAVSESSDGGSTWSALATIAAAGGNWVEPYVQLLDDGTLLCLLQDYDTNRVYTSTSVDGSTWSAVSSAFDGWGRLSHVQFASGTVVALFRAKAASRSAQFYVGRVSRDRGATWGAAFTVDDARMAYGQLVEVSGGLAAFAYGIEDPVLNATNGDVFFRYLVDGSGVVSLIAPSTDSNLDAGGVRDAGRWEVLVTGNPAEAITTADGTDWLYTWITEET